LLFDAMFRAIHFSGGQIGMVSIDAQGKPMMHATDAHGHTTYVPATATINAKANRVRASAAGKGIAKVRRALKAK